MGLIVVGGLGYTVVLELLHRLERWIRRKPASPLKWSLQTRLVLRVSAILIVGGAAALSLTGLTHDEDTWPEQLIHALFQSVTARTAGFNSVNIVGLPSASLLILVLLMYIGGSPGSCAGGIKTTSAAVWVARVRARLLSREDVTLLDRRIPRDVVRRSALVISVATIWNLVGVFLLTITEGGHDGVRLDHLIFEQISAFGTVGLSANVTPTLSELGRLWITLTMFIGRVGPLTVALVVIAAPRTSHHLPNERLMIG
jgi:trk system potassium uptake protein TrkH